MLEGTFFFVSSFLLLLWRCPDGSLRYDLFMRASLSLVLCGMLPVVGVFFCCPLFYHFLCAFVLFFFFL